MQNNVILQQLGEPMFNPNVNQLIQFFLNIL